ncbi:hypothetical protein [Paraflavitalea sp. CAU 1676]|uniref:hypothetical protein n=1 Tax=Paraflavitalea sp. CAU 1676 TaxID=3032598 RepID=UPI0023DC3572|nr:hypothetical protein [Paraflavitalea sp. CAU 1676]MDF2188331.1 hypothetical protein [Paraflavitalea sp. CAU 1676]
MKYYLVASSSCCLVGIEQCVVYIVVKSRRAAFEKEFAGRILQASKNRQALPPVQLRLYH